MFLQDARRKVLAAYDPMRILKITVGTMLIVAASVSCSLQEVKEKVAPVAKGDTAFTFQDPALTESSGLAASLHHEDVYWTHNDSGSQPVLYAVNAKDGTTKAKITLTGVTAVDWEAVAVAKDGKGKPFIYVGDIGDNTSKREKVLVHRIPEPRTLADASVDVETYEFTYEDGPRDAESLLVDPRNGSIYIASKAATGGALYRAPTPVAAGADAVLARIADAPVLTTDGAFSSDGSRFVLRTYVTAEVYSVPGKHIASVPIPIQQQGESVAFSRDDAALLLGSEGVHSAVKRVALDGAVRPSGPSGP